MGPATWTDDQAAPYRRRPSKAGCSIDLLAHTHTSCIYTEKLHHAARNQRIVHATRQGGRPRTQPRGGGLPPRGHVVVVVVLVGWVLVRVLPQVRRRVLVEDRERIDRFCGTEELAALCK